jgi:hypothetical protein
MGNGTTSQGTVLKIKPDDTGNTKNALAAVAALMPCSACGSSAVERLSKVHFVKGLKKAAIRGGTCEECLRLVSFCKKPKANAGTKKKAAEGDGLPPELVEAMKAAKAKKKSKKKKAQERLPETKAQAKVNANHEDNNSNLSPSV